MNYSEFFFIIIFIVYLETTNVAYSRPSLHIQRKMSLLFKLINTGQQYRCQAYLLTELTNEREM